MDKVRDELRPVKGDGDKDDLQLWIDSHYLSKE